MFNDRAALRRAACFNRIASNHDIVHQPYENSTSGDVNERNPLTSRASVDVSVSVRIA